MCRARPAISADTASLLIGSPNLLRFPWAVNLKSSLSSISMLAYRTLSDADSKKILQKTQWSASLRVAIDDATRGQ